MKHASIMVHDQAPRAFKPRMRALDHPALGTTTNDAFSGYRGACGASHSPWVGQSVASSHPESFETLPKRPA